MIVRKMTRSLLIAAGIFCLLLIHMAAQAQAELGANYNHDPELIELELLDRSGVSWVRVTPRFYQFLEGSRNVLTDEGIGQIIEAKQAGYKVIFGWRFDFRQNNERIPVPGSQRETEMLRVLSDGMQRLGPYIDIYTLGNEPNLETLNQDMIYQDSHEGVPLVVFTRRQLDLVVERYYEIRDDLQRPAIYGGSIPALFESGVQNNAAVQGLLRMAQNEDQIEGFDLHLHISSFQEVERAFQFARSIMPEKPFIITEFSLHRLYRSRISETLNVNQAGEDFALQYGHDPDMRLYQWYQYANNAKIQPQELADLFATRDWFPEGYLNTYREAFNRYGVKVATYPILQQSAPLTFDTGSPLWFLNPVFMQVTLAPESDGSLGANPLVADDYLEWASYRNEPTGLDFGDLDEGDTILFPNPAVGRLTLDNIREPFTVNILNLKGQSLYSNYFRMAPARIDVSFLKEGTYLLQVKTGTKVETGKLIIQR